ncbi:MAG: thioredoxin family protein [Longimicrobiales bacterium]
MRNTIVVAAALLTMGVTKTHAQEINHQALFQKGRAYPEFLSAAKARKELWDKNQARAVVADDLVGRARAIGSKLRLLVIAIDGCSDSASIIPYIAKLAELSAIELRIVAPDDGGRAVMEANRTPDGRAATPTIVILDGAYQKIGVFVERPSSLHAWYEEREKTGLETSKLTEQKLEWYQRDAGHSTLLELVALMEKAVR